jgi:NhaA family Na+:H+ antiporter
MHEGELSDLRRAALPLAAALGGMLVPAAICAALTAGGEGAAGWAIPMATDIAFAVGILTILGSRVPPALRVLLLALAVIDDIGAIVVIAIFYSGGVDLAWLAACVGAMAAVALLRGLGVRAPLAYVVPGIALWASLYQAGIHPTLAGVILGMMTPARSWIGRAGFAEKVAAHVAEIPKVERHEALGHLDAIGRARREAVSPSAYLQHILHPWVAYGVMPVFAFANAGVGLGGADLAGDGWFLFLGILLGLAVGKPLGVFVACRLAIGARLSVRPRHVSDRGLGVVGLVSGIGFTMSLFIAQLAFPSGPLLQTAKLAVLAGSGAAMLVASVYGVVALAASPESGSEREAESGHEV